MEFAAKLVGILIGAVAITLLMALPTMWLTNHLFTPAALMAVFGEGTFVVR